MDLRAVIAANLKALRDYQINHGGLLTSERAIAREAKLHKNTVNRMLRPGKTTPHPAVDTLEAVAGVFGLPAWALLADKLDPQQRPIMTTEQALDDEAQRRADAITAALLQGLKTAGKHGQQGKADVTNPYADSPHPGKKPARTTTVAAKKRRKTSVKEAKT